MQVEFRIYYSDPMLPLRSICYIEFHSFEDALTFANIFFLPNEKVSAVSVESRQEPNYPHGRTVHTEKTEDQKNVQNPTS